MKSLSSIFRANPITTLVILFGLVTMILGYLSELIFSWGIVAGLMGLWGAFIAVCGLISLLILNYLKYRYAHRTG